MASSYQQLQDAASALIPVLHGLIVQRQAALTANDTAEAARLAVLIQARAQEYNGYVDALRQIEGPTSTMRFLDRVGDVVIQGVQSGATIALQVPGAIGSAVGRGAANLLLPLAIPVALLLLAGIWLAGRSGALRVKVSR